MDLRQPVSDRRQDPANRRWWQVSRQAMPRWVAGELIRSGVFCLAKLGGIEVVDLATHPDRRSSAGSTPLVVNNSGILD